MNDYGLSGYIMRETCCDESRKRMRYLCDERLRLSSLPDSAEKRDQIGQVVSELRWLEEGGCNTHNREEH